MIAPRQQSVGVCANSPFGPNPRKAVVEQRRVWRSGHARVGLVMPCSGEFNRLQAVVVGKWRWGAASMEVIVPSFT